MIQRVKIDKWISDRCFKLVHTSGTTKPITTYLPVWDFEDSMWVFEKAEKLGVKGTLDLVKIAHCAGAYSRLWIGDLDGVLAPMDMPPQGWTYPNQKPAESAWFWQWTPSAKAEQTLMQELRKSNPLSNQIRYLKTLVPYSLEQKHGAIAQINAIDLVRLPELFGSKVSFLFEIEV